MKISKIVLAGLLVAVVGSGCEYYTSESVDGSKVLPVARDSASDSEGGEAEKGVAPTEVAGRETPETERVEVPTDRDTGREGGEDTTANDTPRIGPEAPRRLEDLEAVPVTPPSASEVLNGRLPADLGPGAVEALVPNSGSASPIGPVETADIPRDALSGGASSAFRSIGMVNDPALFVGANQVEAVSSSGDTLVVVARDRNGILQVCSGASDKGSETYRCFDLVSVARARGQVAAVHQKNQSGGLIHLFYRNDRDRLAYVYCPAQLTGASACRQSTLNGDLEISDNPSAVALKSGLIYVFVNSPFGFPRTTRLFYFAGQGGSQGLEGGFALSMKGLWYSPKAVAYADETGTEKIAVFARDDDPWNGHLRMTVLHQPGIIGADANAETLTFDGEASSGMGDMSLGSSPAAFYSRWTHQFTIVGKEHATAASADSHLVLWETFERIRNKKRIGLKTSVAIGENVNSPWSDVLGAAVYKNGSAQGSVHAAYRGTEDKLCVSRSEAATTVFTSDCPFVGAIDTVLGDFSPALSVDSKGNLNAVGVRQDSRLGLVRLTKNLSSGSWKGDYLPAIHAEGSPTLLLVPAPSLLDNLDHFSVGIPEH